MRVEPFEVAFDEARLADVLERVAAYELPPAPEGGGWEYGCDADYLEAFRLRWLHGWDRRDALATLNRYPQGRVEIDGQGLHFAHVVGEAEGRRPLVLLHGWPGAYAEFLDVAGPLAFPSRHGGRAEDAFDLVIPSLPGFGFSAPPPRPIGQRRTAVLIDRLMREVLGYRRYRAQGGDWGALVAGWLGLDHREACRAIHLNMLGLRSAAPPEGPDELAWAREGADAMRALGAYFQLQATKPQSLAWAAAGNPMGQAAWILERFHDWSDLSTRPFEAVHPMDRLITHVMIYVMTGGFTTSLWYYRGLFEEGGALLPPGTRVEAPTAFANFPGEPLYRPPPRSLAEKAYNLVLWRDMPSGGHFAALEEPELFVEAVREFGRETDGA